MRGEEDNKKKKGQKRGQRVPIHELGFKAKVYYGIETEYRRQRVRYKAAKYGAQNSKDCFMGRLRFTIDAAELALQQLQNLASFKGIKKNEWNKVRQIVYHSKQELSCAICLQKKFQAPQMTSCGHVFCWHCILMHHYKSLKACFCPVCNEAYEIENIVTCQPFFTKAFKQIQSNKVRFALKARRQGDSRVYDPDTLVQDLNFARVVRATPQKILSLFQEQRNEIQENIKSCDDEQIKKWMQRVHSLSWQRIDKVQKYLGKKDNINYLKQHHRRDHLANGFIFSVLDQKERATLTNFYQEQSGRLIFLHPICDKFIRKASAPLPRTIEEEIIYWEQAEYDVQLRKRYKQISHITINQEVDLVIVNIQKLMDNSLEVQFEEELGNFRQRKKEELARQQRQAQRLSEQYEEQKQYLARLKKLEQSEFYDIRVPTTLDITELQNTALFPSLIQTKSMPSPTQPQQPKNKQIDKKNNKKPQVKIFTQGDFPDLIQKKQITLTKDIIIETPKQLISAKSEQITVKPIKKEDDDFPSLGQKKQNGTQGSKKQKKKKEKFVNVTDMFFKQPEEEREY